MSVLFLSFGGPEKPEEIMPFLENVTRGRGISKERLLGVAEHYSHIGGKSPINDITRSQAEGLRRFLKKKKKESSVYLGLRHSAPSVETALRQMMQDGVKRAAGFYTAAYRSEASLDRYVAAVDEARAKIGPDAPEIDFVGPWFDHPLFIAAICARVEELSAPKDAPWVFTAHSIPCGMAKESTYVEELRETASLVARKFGKSEWTLAYTSRSGRPIDPWLEPDISSVIKAAAESGIKELVVIPIGFVADHVEVLYDLDVEAKACAETAGIKLHRALTVGDHPLFIEMIADVVTQRASSDLALARSSAATEFRDGRKAVRVGVMNKTCFCFPGRDDAPCLRPPAPRGRPG